MNFSQILTVSPTLNLPFVIPPTLIIILVSVEAVLSQEHVATLDSRLTIDFAPTEVA